jgi:hypothetical protein
MKEKPHIRNFIVTLALNGFFSCVGRTGQAHSANFIPRSCISFVKALQWGSKLGLLFFKLN